MASSNIFSDLLKRAEKLTSAIIDEPMTGYEKSTFPKVQRNLDEILEQGERLWRKTGGADATKPSGEIGEQPQLSVGKDGQPLDKYQSDLFTFGKSAFDGVGQVETDLESYLRRQREDILCSLVNETVQHVTESIERRQRSAVIETWEQRKKKLLGDATVTSIGDFTMKEYSHQAPGDYSNLGRTGMNDVELAYARQVADYIDKLVRGGAKPKLVDAFLATSRTLRIDGYPILWEQVQCMLELPVQAGKSILEQRVSKRFKVAVAENALRFLERQFIKYMEGIVYGHVEQAQRGGVPGVYHLVNAFLNVKMPFPYTGYEDGLVENHPVWVVIYYCLRCGDIRAAVMTCEAGGPQFAEYAAIFREMESKEFDQMSTETKTRLNLLYRRHVRTSQDPYKRAVFVVMALCDTTVEDPEIVDTLQNWLWYRLRQVRLYEMSIIESTPASTCSSQHSAIGPHAEYASLAFLQKQVFEDYGERHFIAGDSQYLFWEALWLTGQFEAAIEYICRQSEILKCHGVHVALAAHEIGLLLIPQDIQAKLCSADRTDPPLIRRINLVRLILLYISKFQNSDPRDATNYLYFLKPISTTKGENMFCVTLADLVMETGEFEMMLGYIDEDGKRKPGIVDKFSFDAERLVEQVARQCEQKGLNERAVILYDLAMNHTKALELLNDMLTRVCTEAPTLGGDRDRAAKVALEIAKRYRQFGCKADADISTTFYLLMDLVTFFDLYHSKSYSEAIDVMHKLNLVPLDMDAVNQHVKTFYRLSEPIRRLLPQILLALMSMLLTEYRRVKGYMTFTATATGNVEAAESLKNSSRALVTYIGMIPYCMPGDITARIVQMEVLMH